VPVSELAGEDPVPGGQVADPLAGLAGRLVGVRARSSRWVWVAGSGSAERSGKKYWPGWRRRSSASAATASCRWARVAASQSARSAIVWANTVSRCR
jgi:hypothetical protein